MAIHPEALLLSAVIKSGEYQMLASRGITASMFHAYREEAEWLMSYVQRNGKAPSKQAFKQEFTDFVFYKVDDTAHWCEEVRRSHVKQSLVDLFDQSLNLVDADDPDAAMQTVMAGMTSIQTTQKGMNADFDVFEQWEEVYSQVSDRVDRVRTTGHAGIPTGFKTLDDITGGLQAGWFGVIAARLGEGKTWTGVRMAWAAASTGHSVTYFSLEQSRLQIAQRVHAFGSRQYAKKAFNPMDLNKGKGFDLRDYKAFLMTLKDKKGTGSFYINDTSRGLVTPSIIGAVVEERQPAIIFIDYLTLLGTTTDDWRGTAKVSSELQGIAQRYGIPVVAMSQMNRLGIGKEPGGTEHLSQADAIGQDADIVLTMKQMSKSVMKMRLAKFRHGSGGDTWFANFNPGNGEYEEMTSQDAQDAIEADQEED